MPSKKLTPKPEVRERNQQQYELDQAIAAIRANARDKLIQDARNAVIEAAKAWAKPSDGPWEKPTDKLLEAVAKLEALEGAKNA